MMSDQPSGTIEREHDLRVLIANERPDRLAVVTDILTRLGIPDGTYDQLDAGSPYAYDEQALLFCPLHLPDPRHEGFEAAMHDELTALIEAAEGRTLALFTSWRAMRAAAAGGRPRPSHSA